MGKTAPVEIKVAPPGRIVLCLTVRDLFGRALPDMKVTIGQGTRSLLSAKATDPHGRVIVPEVETTGPLSINLDGAYIPNDTSVLRPIQYKYIIEQVGKSMQVFVTNGAPVPPQLDIEKAYLTIFAKVDPPFTPKFRFPWQNPIHRSTDLASDAIYANRERVLNEIIVDFFGHAPSTVPDHDGLVTTLLELFQSNALPKGTPNPAPTSSPDHGAAEGGPPPDSVPIPPPPSDPPPANVVPAPLAIKPEEPSPPPPAPTPPPSPPPPASDPRELPKWVWYLFFHYAGHRYTPHKADGVTDLRSNGAHGSYLDPSRVIRAVRASELQKQFPAGSKGSGPPAAMPSKEDVTEACVLSETIQAKAQALSSLGALLNASPTKVSAEIVRLWGKVAADAEKKTRAMVRDDLNGDYFALGLLRAMRLKGAFTDLEWKVIVSRTELRNDVTSNDWEVKEENIPTAAFDEPFREAYGGTLTAWKTRHPQTLDLITCSAVCNQESEIGGHARGQVLPGGIPANAAALSPLLSLTFANAPAIRRGTHFFYDKYEAPSTSHQMYPSDSLAVDAWFLERPPKGSTVVAGPTDISKLIEKSGPAAQYYDPDSPMNVRFKLMGKPPNVVKADAGLTALFKMPARDVAGNPAHSSYPGDAFLRLNSELNDEYAFKDPQDPKAGVVQVFDESVDPKTGKKKKIAKKISVPRLEVLKWSHQEIVIHVNRFSDRVAVFLWSTSGDAGGNAATGVRTIVVRLVQENPNVLFGAPAPEQISPDLERIFLNPSLLKGKP